MTIYLDAMGGDHAPTEIIKGACLAVKEYQTDVTLIGNEDIIADVIRKENLSYDRITVIDAKEEIAMDEEPASAVKRKKNSSLVVGASKIKEDPSSIFVSAGSTGALLAAALLYTGRIKGIQRPALGTVLPGKTPTLLIDNGANAECKPEYLVQFALMGTIYMKALYGIESPRVALANIGSEEMKGNTLYKETFKLLKETDLNFIGNLEPKELLNGVTDIIVCDGFTGNIILKSLEGCFGYTFSLLKDVFMKSVPNKLAASVLKKDLAILKNKMDPTVYGGVPLLGINGGIIKAHGNSNAKAFKNAVRQAIIFQENNVIDNIRNRL